MRRCLNRTLRPIGPRERVSRESLAPTLLGRLSLAALACAIPLHAAVGDQTQEEFEEWKVEVRVEPRTVCVGERFETNPIARVRVKGGEREARLPNGHAVYRDAMVPFVGGRTTGFMAQGPVGVQSVELSFDLGGGRMLAHQALVQVIECPGPSQPIAFADFVTTKASDQLSAGDSEAADLWAGSCYAALELQPGFVAPEGRDDKQVAAVSQQFAEDAAELAGDHEERADKALKNYAKRQNKQAEALLDDDEKDAREVADEAADDLAEARDEANEATMFRFLQQIFQNHAAGNRLAARADQSAPVDPKYCAERMSWFAAQRPTEQRRPQSDSSTQMRNQMLMQSLQGISRGNQRPRQGFGVQGVFGNN